MSSRKVLLNCCAISALALVMPGYADDAEKVEKPDASVHQMLTPDVTDNAPSAHQREIQRLREEKELLELDNALQLEKNKRELADLTAQRDKLLLENEIKEAQQEQLNAELTTEKERLELEIAIREAKQRQAMAKLETKKSLLELENAIQEAQNRSKQLSIELESSQLALETARMEYERSKRNKDMEEIDEKLARRAKMDEWEARADKDPEYLMEPFQDGKLIISDRRVYINGPIIPGLGDYVTERINFYNNKNQKYPIFMIIDRCTGGSVVEGAQMLKAMESSKAPIYVVVRSLSASMAAVLTALADKSYAYPNAVLLHHQVSSFFVGNLTQQKEQLKLSQAWADRLMTPVAERMGLTLAEFFDAMYEHNSDGNWYEFADNALELGWIDGVVTEVEDTSYLRMPLEMPEDEPQGMFLQAEEKIDAQGNRYMQLPHLGPGDFYYMYNPDNYYR